MSMNKQWFVMVRAVVIPVEKFTTVEVTTKYHENLIHNGPVNATTTLRSVNVYIVV